MDNIKSVKLVTHFEIPDAETGERLPVAQPHFLVEQVDGDELRVPFEPLNRHYIEVSEWYKDQKKPGFKFDFKKHKPL